MCALIPVLCRQCSDSWDSKGETQYSCSTKDLNPDDLTRPCRLFIRELEFNKELGKKKNESVVYNMMDINDISQSTGTPIEILIRTKRNKKKDLVFHCGKTQLSDEERKKGWCATKLDSEGMLELLNKYKYRFCSKTIDKIERWGFCREDCQDKKDTFMFANMNLLTDTECNTLFSQVSPESYN